MPNRETRSVSFGHVTAIRRHRKSPLRRGRKNAGRTDAAPAAARQRRRRQGLTAARDARAFDRAQGRGRAGSGSAFRGQGGTPRHGSRRCTRTPEHNFSGGFNVTILIEEFSLEKYIYIYHPLDLRSSRGNKNIGITDFVGVYVNSAKKMRRSYN